MHLADSFARSAFGSASAARGCKQPLPALYRVREVRPMALKLLMFSDFICPFCYIGFEVVRKLKPEFDLEIDWRGFQIHPEWPAEGMPASEYRSMDEGTRRAVWQRIQSLANEAGFSMKPPELLMNSRLSLEAAEFAKEAGAGEAFEERVYRAYFQEGQNIGDRGVLGDLAERSRAVARGIEPCAGDEPLFDASQEYRACCESAWRERRADFFRRAVPDGRGTERRQ